MQDVIICIPRVRLADTNKTPNILESEFQNLEIKSLEYIGLEVGTYLSEQGSVAALLAMIAYSIAGGCTDFLSAQL